MYEQSKPLSAFGSTLDMDELPLPEGESLSPELIAALSSLPTDMEMPASEVLTPWAVKESDFTWQPNTEAPKYNLQTYKISTGQVRQGYDKLFGQPIPYLAIVSKDQIPKAQMESALDGTDYDLYETIAVYDQADKSTVPQIAYFHWISMSEEGKKRTRTLGQAVSDVHGHLRFAARVSYADTAARAFPAMSFDEATDTELNEISEEDINTFENPEVPTPTTNKQAAQPSLVGPLVAGLAVAALTVCIGKALSK